MPRATKNCAAVLFGNVSAKHGTFVQMLVDIRDVVSSAVGQRTKPGKPTLAVSLYFRECKSAKC